MVYSLWLDLITQEKLSKSGWIGLLRYLKHLYNIQLNLQNTFSNFYQLATYVDFVTNKTFPYSHFFHEWILNWKINSINFLSRVLTFLFEMAAMPFPCNGLCFVVFNIPTVLLVNCSTPYFNFFVFIADGLAFALNSFKT